MKPAQKAKVRFVGESSQIVGSDQRETTATIFALTFTLAARLEEVNLYTEHIPSTDNTAQASQMSRTCQFFSPRLVRPVLPSLIATSMKRKTKANWLERLPVTASRGWPVASASFVAVAAK